MEDQYSFSVSLPSPVPLLTNSTTKSSPFFNKWLNRFRNGSALKRGSYMFSISANCKQWKKELLNYIQICRRRAKILAETTLTQSGRCLRKRKMWRNFLPVWWGKGIQKINIFNNPKDISIFHNLFGNRKNTRKKFSSLAINQLIKVIDWAGFLEPFLNSIISKFFTLLKLLQLSSFEQWQCSQMSSTMKIFPCAYPWKQQEKYLKTYKA